MSSIDQWAPEISTHALREEGDTGCRTDAGTASDFYPRPPRGGRLYLSHLFFSGPKISTHALREEGDHSGHR